jgi:hypothetical protein
VGSIVVAAVAAVVDVVYVCAPDFPCDVDDLERLPEIIVGE